MHKTNMQHHTRSKQKFVKGKNVAQRRHSYHIYINEKIVIVF